MRTLKVPRQYWSENEISFIKENHSKYNVEELANHLNRLPRSIYYILNNLKIPLEKQVSHIGKRFGNLQVVKFSESRSADDRLQYQCICDCGSETLVTSSNLTSGNTLSCGCHKIKMSSIEPGGISWNYLYISSRQGAKRRDLVFELSKEDHRKLSEQNCFYCNDSPKRYNCYVRNDGTIRRSPSQETVDRAWINAGGIDRLNNDIGYTNDNCVACCSKCNFAKQDASLDEFLIMICKIYKNIFQRKMHDAIFGFSKRIS